MDALWDGDAPITAGELRDKLATARAGGKAPALTTDPHRALPPGVQGLRRRDREARPHLYVAALSRAGHVADLMREVLESSSDRTEALAYFVGLGRRIRGRDAAPPSRRAQRVSTDPVAPLAGAIFLGALAIALAWPVPLLLARAKWPPAAPVLARRAVAVHRARRWHLDDRVAAARRAAARSATTCGRASRAPPPPCSTDRCPPRRACSTRSCSSAAILLTAHLILNLALTSVRSRNQRHRHMELLRLLSLAAAGRPEHPRHRPSRARRLLPAGRPQRHRAVGGHDRPARRPPSSTPWSPTSARTCGRSTTCCWTPSAPGSARCPGSRSPPVRRTPSPCCSRC